MNKIKFLLISIYFLGLLSVWGPQQVSAAVTGSGTSADPYSVGNAADLTTALSNGGGTSSTIYVQLTNDITYTDSNQFNISSNVVVNGLKDNTAGSYYKMLKTGTSTTTSTAGFYLTASGYDVTFENLSFGDDTYSYYQTYYGILLGTSYQADLVLKNVDYYAQNGGQPLVTYNGNTTFTLEGTNNFNVQPGTNTQEFMEGSKITFAADSVTNITHNSSSNTAFFYNTTSTNSTSTTTINVEANAYVNISTNKTYFVYDRSTLNLNLADSATFIYTATASGFNFAAGTGTTSTYTVGNNATLALSGAGRIGSTGSATATINATTPQEISFKNTSGTGLFSSNSTLNPTTSDAYLFNYTVSGNSTTASAPSSAITLSDSTFATNVSQVSYYPKANVTFAAAGNVTEATAESNSISTLDVTQLAVSSDYVLQEADYKIFSTSPLADDADISTDDNQALIENATDAIYTGQTTATSFSLDQVAAGTYSVFVKATAVSSSGRITQVTQWAEQTVTISKSVLNVSIPIEMTFAIVDNGEFTSPTSYEAVNRSNFATSFGIDSVTDVQGITLVNNLENTTATNPLYLGLESTDGTTEIPFISDGANTNSFNLAGFGGSTAFNLVGQYGGTVSLTNIQELQYTLTVVISGT